MSNGPGIYHYIGKKARDVLYKDYAPQPPNKKIVNWGFDFSCQIDDIVPGLNTAFAFILPYQNEMEVQYLHEYAGITAGISLPVNTLLNFSGVIGSSLLSIGTDLSFDVARESKSDWDEIMRNNMGDTVKASWYQPLSPLTNSAIAAELSHSIFSSETIFTLGTQYSPFPLTLMKARMSSNGKLGALVRQELVPSVYLTIAGDVDVRTEARSAKLGLSLAIKP